MLLSILAAIICWDTGLKVLAILNAMVAFFSYGVASNFKGARPEDVPSWTVVAPVTTVVAVVLGVLGFMAR